ncbi:ribosome hibernation-promoting factor, HPF/YfiA family [Cellulosimicrobium sp. CUA-896]|uniref:ribosome hibernation-promoting factor, HPF/YfiA family n=1 Tax=Cellulosimicrobium sp. CUA-896 TaxID=1517881 RepID=UPI00095E48D3|nr:ribosome-associated translation inhibitor RaiA [Cellulosimicrobium sp. CUA-896]OLT55413.1 ribosomal subunit interface protein [Cellulosimicrobium sp. CUA-896]
MEIVVVGRHTEVAERFRQHAEDKLAKVQQLAPTVQRVDVEVTHENNPRLSEVRERVELTVRAKGPVIRAEAAADDRFGALDLAMDKLAQRLRRARDRRKDHRNHTVVPPVDVRPFDPAAHSAPEPAAPTAPTTPGEAVETPLGDGESPVVIRQKLHNAEPMTVDDALYEMEMVGHDFFLFVDVETARPSVAYRRRGWTYGVVALDTSCDCAEEPIGKSA